MWLRSCGRAFGGAFLVSNPHFYLLTRVPLPMRADSSCFNRTTCADCQDPDNTGCVWLTNVCIPGSVVVWLPTMCPQAKAGLEGRRIDLGCPPVKGPAHLCLLLCSDQTGLISIATTLAHTLNPPLPPPLFFIPFLRGRQLPNGLPDPGPRRGLRLVHLYQLQRVRVTPKLPVGLRVCHLSGSPPFLTCLCCVRASVRAGRAATRVFLVNTMGGAWVCVCVFVCFEAMKGQACKSVAGRWLMPHLAGFSSTVLVFRH